MPKENKYTKIIGANLRQFRRQRGISQEEMGEHFDITFQQVQKYEKGLNRFSCCNLAVLSEIYNVPVSSFFEPVQECEELDKTDFIILRAIKKMIRNDPKTAKEVFKLIKHLNGN